jgi:serine/threonine protein kinase
MFNPIAAALDAAASQGLFHSDLKPGNILFDKQGNPVVAELGLAQVLNSLTVARPIPPNPAYASPEQVRGALLDAHSQVYSLGTILYHALTGQPPSGATDDHLLKHVSENPVVPENTP